MISVFGMKKSLSGSTWGGSAWDGVSVYGKQTQEYVDGKYMTVAADFRKYKGSEKGWGRLKSGAGWIALSFCERV